MKCAEPVLVGYSSGRKANGDLRFVSVKNCRPDEVDDRFLLFGHEVTPIYAPCGKCPLCIKARKRDCTTRIVHEARVASASWFITLTYAPEHLPFNNDFLQEPTLVKRHIQLFLKRLRKACPNDHIRYVEVGEYGAKFGRPHYHLIIFGLPDLPLVFHEHRVSYDTYRSPLIERCWPFGFSVVTRFDYSNARYVAQYVRKKQDLQAISPYVEKPFMTASRGKSGEGGYGAPYFDKYHSEMLRDGFCVLSVRGHMFKVPLPSYYLRRARERYHDEWLSLVLRRAEYAMRSADVTLSPEEYQNQLAEIASECAAITARENQALKNRRYENG